MFWFSPCHDFFRKWDFFHPRRIAFPPGERFRFAFNTITLIKQLDRQVVKVFKNWTPFHFKQTNVGMNICHFNVHCYQNLVWQILWKKLFNHYCRFKDSIYLVGLLNESCGVNFVWIFSKPIPLHKTTQGGPDTADHSTTRQR